MTKRERVIAAIKKEAVDYVPCGFSLHFPTEVATGSAGVKSHLGFFDETDTDILKIMNENLLPYVGTFKGPEDYAKIQSFSMKDSFMSNQIDFTKRILDACEKSAFTMGTLHGVTASAIHPVEKAGFSYDQSRVFHLECLRSNPQPVLDAMQRIADGMCELATSYIEAGVDSVYYAALGAERRYFTDEEFSKWIAPYDKQIMSAIKAAGGYCFLHSCKDGLNMKRYEGYAKYCDVANWGVYEAPFALSEGKSLFANKTIMGGLENRSGLLVDGTDEQIKEEVQKVIAGFGKKGFILGADCTLATEQDLHKLRVAIEASRVM
ncbi:uroporphyrinogen decarboxylase family protein [uncultured Sphaerochaeta sp.]|uniref:uroporphyrinogen decarboxylase family protein n=1 Tax=uncultured Sphaerochaeta sp. TaxID=886478 RepID=UPI002A0A1DB0|nr:uroporphyrinogen decarboxylase family protein [uncultured Sphaerochaeta sp.]